MRAGWIMAMVALAAGCGRGEPSSGSSAALAGARWVEAPGWVASADELASADGWTLVRGTTEALPEGTDARPPVPLAVVRDDGRALLPPAAVLEAALLEGAVAWVTVDGTLLLDDAVQPQVVDRDVHGELDVSPDGRRLAYATRPGPDAGVWIVGTDGSAPRRLTVGLAVADRPRFVDDAHLVVCGAPPGGIAGVWLLRYAGLDPQPRPVTNGSLRAGRPLGPTFVPPPAYHDSMRVVGDELVYHDGETERRVSLAEVLP